MAESSHAPEKPAGGEIIVAIPEALAKCLVAQMSEPDTGPVGNQVEDLVATYENCLRAVSPAPWMQATRRKRDKDWSDYEFPTESVIFERGDRSRGLAVHAPALFSRPGVPGGWMLHIAFYGLPEGLEMHGHGDVQNFGESVLALAVEGPLTEPGRAALAAFQKGMSEWLKAIAPEIEALREPVAPVILPPHFPDALEPPPKVLARSKAKPRWKNEDVEIPIRPHPPRQLYERLLTWHARLFAPFADEAANLKWSKESVSQAHKTTSRGHSIVDETTAVDCRNELLCFGFEFHAHSVDGKLVSTVFYFKLIKLRVIGFHASGTETPGKPITNLTFHRAFTTEKQALQIWRALREVLE